MEKKSRYPQSSTKGAAGDAKKNQDVNSKLFPKTSRRREPTASSTFPKYEQSRKTGAQKGKNFDKRPKPKGQYHGGPKEETKVVEAESAELGSVMVQGSKKQNLNHLLNFHYTPRDVQSGSIWSQGRISTKYNYNSNRWLPPVQRHKYNKEQFLQANCQFVVAADGDYTAYLADPDALVDWKLIEQIRVHSSESLSCPICLCAPVAGKMTRCGHVYCWPCILHYLALSDKTWRKCPICYESIHKSDLKSVVEITQNALNIGDKVSLRLMRREKGSLLAVPVEKIEPTTPTTFFPVSGDTSNSVYSKLLLANSTDVIDIIECERAQLNIELLDDPHSPENCFIEQALGELHAREEQLFNTVKEKSVHVNETASIKQMPMSENLEQLEQEGYVETYQDDEGAGSLSRNNICCLDELLANETSSLSSDSQAFPNASKFFYFYQAEDGQHIYLHAMNVKMLELQYGSLVQCPKIISGKLLEKEAGSFTEELRRRLRYLCHLPLTCQFEIAEIELTPPLISNRVLDHFCDQLQIRQKRRQRREREERKRERKITEEENKRMGKYPVPNVHIESQWHFPQFQPNSSSETNIPSPSESVATMSVASSPSTSTFDELGLMTRELNNLSLNTSEQSPSFAEMLRNTGTRVGVDNVWPSMSVSHSIQSRSVVSAQQSMNIDAEIEGYVPAPSYSQSFGDALAHALEQPQLLDAGVKTKNSKILGKKRKRNKPTVLFATSMARAP